MPQACTTTVGTSTPTDAIRSSRFARSQARSLTSARPDTAGSSGQSITLATTPSAGNERRGSSSEVGADMGGLLPVSDPAKLAPGGARGRDAEQNLVGDRAE